MGGYDFYAIYHRYAKWPFSTVSINFVVSAQYAKISFLRMNEIRNLMMKKICYLWVLQPFCRKGRI